MRVSGFGIHRKNPFELYFLSLVVAGVVVGTFLFQSLFSVSQFYVEALRPSDAGIKTLIKLFFKGFAGNSVFMLVLFVCGFSAVLQPFILMTGFIRGVGIGLVVSSIYSSIGAQGIFNAFVYVAIPSFFTVLALVIAAREAEAMSLSIARAIFSERNFIGFRESSRLYVLKFAILEIIVAVGSAVEILCSSFINVKF